MSSATSVDVELEGDSIRVRDLTVEDPEAVEYLANHDEAAASEFVRRAFEIGLTAMRLTQTTVDVEFVERKFNEMVTEFSEEVTTATDEFGDQVDDVTDELDTALGENGRLDDELDAYLGSDGELATRLENAFAADGPFAERLDDELGENGERIQTALDPDTDGTPTNVLRSEIQELRDVVKEGQGAQSVIQQSTLKGGDFEETVGNILGRIAAHTSDSYHFTGDEVGEIPDTKVGDFVYELGGTDKRIVIEAKTEDYSYDQIEEEMETAIENRDADYGVFVTDHLGNIPRTKLGWFHEVDDFVTVALSEGPDSEIEPAFLRFALNWAQVRVLHDVGSATDDIDTTEIRSQAEAIDTKMDRFTQVRKQCTSIEDAVEEIRDELEAIEAEVDKRIATLKGELATQG